MFLSYVDDAGSTGNNLEDSESRFQVIGGPVIHEDYYPGVELMLRASIEDVVPQDEWDDFEYHTCDLFHAKKPFDVLGLDKCHALLERALKWIAALKFPIIYGAVDKSRLSRQLVASASPVDVAFRLYLDSLDKWYSSVVESRAKAAPPNSNWEFPYGLLIVDKSRKDVTRQIQNAYRGAVPKVRSRGFGNDLSLHIFDDVYFGDSKTSTGIQIADIVVYFIGRHLAEKADSEGFYNIIRDQIFAHRIYPE